MNPNIKIKLKIVDIFEIFWDILGPFSVPRESILILLWVQKTGPKWSTYFATQSTAMPTGLYRSSIPRLFGTSLLVASLLISLTFLWVLSIKYTLSVKKENRKKVIMFLQSTDQNNQLYWWFFYDMTKASIFRLKIEDNVACQKDKGYVNSIQNHWLCMIVCRQAHCRHLRNLDMSEKLSILTSSNVKINSLHLNFIAHKVSKTIFIWVILNHFLASANQYELFTWNILQNCFISQYNIVWHGLRFDHKFVGKKSITTLFDLSIRLWSYFKMWYVKILILSSQTCLNISK